MIGPWEDPRVAAGLAPQMATRRRTLADGAEPVGWKVGFGAPTALELMEISAPLLGHLTSETVAADGTVFATESWQRGIVEFEVAVRMRRDLVGGASPEEAAAAVDAIGPAIELADVDGPIEPSAVSAIVAGNIFHKAVVFGEFDDARAGLDIAGLEGVVSVDSEVRASVSDLEEITGRYPDIVATVASTLASVGEVLSAGAVIITGSIVPPIPVTEGQRFGFRLGSGPPIEVRVAS